MIYCYPTSIDSYFSLNQRSFQNVCSILMNNRYEVLFYWYVISVHYYQFRSSYWVLSCMGLLIWTFFLIYWIVNNFPVLLLQSVKIYTFSEAYWSSFHFLIWSQFILSKVSVYFSSFTLISLTFPCLKMTKSSDIFTPIYPWLKTSYFLLSHNVWPCFENIETPNFYLLAL